MDNSPLISVLVPVYNVGRYLCQCVESVLAQTYQNWELVLVDDGSTDNSPDICDSYAANDERINVVHKQNKGLASARNAGLQASTGEWVMMLDGDDWIEPYTLESMHNLAVRSGADFVKAGMYYDYPDYSLEYHHDTFDSKEMYLSKLISRSTSLSIWAGLYKREAFYKLTPMFTDGLDYGEDYSVIARLLSVSESFAILDKPVLHYRQNDSSIVHTPTWDKALQLIACEKINSDYFENKPQYDLTGALKLGRARIKASVLKIILCKFHEMKEHVPFARGLYDGSLDYSTISFDDKIVLAASSLSDSMVLARMYWGIRSLVSHCVRFVRHMKYA